MRYIVGILVVGLMLLCVSMFMRPYSDEVEFQRRYEKLTHQDSAEFYRLRSEFETRKYQVFDYGFSAVLLSLVSCAFLKVRRLRSSPTHLILYAAIALLVPLLFSAGYVADLIVAYNRGEFPHWADSLGIPLAGAPAIFAFLSILSFGMLLFLPWRGLREQSLKVALKWPMNLPLSALAIVLGVITLFFLALGQWWYWPAAAVATYQSLCLIASRKALN
jgi:hypothetical protein